ncbi:MAG: hypothetical protein R2991_12770 [Thermoanaerobaculia bacterium]
MAESLRADRPTLLDDVQEGAAGGKTGERKKGLRFERYHHRGRPPLRRSRGETRDAVIKELA